MRWRRRLGSRRMRIRGCRSGRFGLCSRWWMGVWGSRGWRAWPRISGDRARTWIRRGGLGGSVPFGISRSCSIGTRCIGRRWFVPGRAGRTAGCRPTGCGRPSSGGGCAQRIGVPDQAERVEGACARLREEPGIVDLPARLSLFGLTRLPAGHLNVLRALAVGRDVHVFMLHPSPALWERVAERGVSVTRRREDPTAALPANRLLASWGQDSREMQLVLGAGDYVDHHHAVEHRTGTLARASAGGCAGGSVARRCAAARRNKTSGRCWTRTTAACRSTPATAARARSRSSGTRSCISSTRIRTLEPRDVIVMCPDIETFAPLIQATFGAGEVFEDDDELEALPADVRPPDLRVRLADRALRQTNPVLGVIGRLLDLVDERLTASQVLDFADQEPVRRRFGLDDDDLARIEDWVAASGIRWGLDAAHRKPFKLDALAAGTWRAGVDRLLVGVTMTEEEQRLFHDVLPLDDVDSGAIDVAGRFAELVDRLQRALDGLSTPKTIDAWAAAIAGAADALTTTSERDAWQRAELDRILGDVADEAAGSGSATSLVPAEIRALLSERLKGRPTRANFRTGHLTICTLMPMRSVPHRVVCLLGMDDGVFPRKSPRDGDDLMLADPHVGDRDARTEDRQLLLDALLAATDQLIVTYTGNDERTNLVRPPAVPIGELLDVIDRTVRTDEGRARERVEVRHPLQPFDPKNFTVGELMPERAWSFDPVTLHGAEALTTERGAARAVPRRAAAAARADPRRARGPRPLRRPPRPRLPAPAARHQRRRLRRRGRRRAARRARRAGALGRRAAAARRGPRRRATSRPASRPRSRAGRCPRASSRRPSSPASARSSRTSRPPPTPSSNRGRRQPASVDVKVALTDGRTLSGTVPGVYGDVLQNRHLLARQRPPPPAGLRPLAGADRGAPRQPICGGHRRAGPPRRARQRDDHDRPHPAARRRRKRARGAGTQSSSPPSSTSTTAACASRSRSPA